MFSDSLYKFNNDRYFHNRNYFYYKFNNNKYMIKSKLEKIDENDDTVNCFNYFLNRCLNSYSNTCEYNHYLC